MGVSITTTMHHNTISKQSSFFKDNNKKLVSCACASPVCRTHDCLSAADLLYQQLKQEERKKVMEKKQKIVLEKRTFEKEGKKIAKQQMQVNSKMWLEMTIASKVKELENLENCYDQFLEE